MTFIEIFTEPALAYLNCIPLMILYLLICKWKYPKKEES